MSLLVRKPRPLTRDAASLRDDRLFIVACDDRYAPKQYFEFFRITRVKIEVVPAGEDASASARVLDKLLQFEYVTGDERWILLDTDHFAQREHLATFVRTLKRAKKNGIKVALSRPCFEIWLLLHHLDDLTKVSSLPNAKKVNKTLSETLGGYNKTKLSAAHLPLASVAEAFKRAKYLDATVKGGDIPAANTTRVYQLWKAITAKALPSQLPAELRNLGK